MVALEQVIHFDDCLWIYQLLRLPPCYWFHRHRWSWWLMVRASQPCMLQICFSLCWMCWRSKLEIPGMLLPFLLVWSQNGPCLWLPMYWLDSRASHKAPCRLQAVVVGEQRFVEECASFVWLNSGRNMRHFELPTHRAVLLFIGDQKRRYLETSPIFLVWKLP